MAEYGGFFREENIIVLEARSMLPPGRLLILSDNLALVLALCTGRSKHFTLLFASRQALSYRSGGYRPN